MGENRTIFRKLFLSYFLIILFVLISVTVYMAKIQTKQIRTVIDNDIGDLAMSLANDPMIIESFERKEIPDDVKKYLDTLKANLLNIDYIVLVGNDDIRLYHPDLMQVGKKFQGGDEGPALKGSKLYITEAVGTSEPQRRAFITVYNSDGENLGFIMVSATMNSILFLQQQEITKYLTIFIIALFIGVTLISIFSENLNKSLLGMEPKQLSQMYLQREDVLGTLSEGLVLLDANGNCEYSNLSAEKYLGNKELLIKNFIEVNVYPKQKQGLPILKEPINYGEYFLLMDIVPVSGYDEENKILVILNDQTENIHLAEELTGARHILEALRATTHEHRNKMHVLFGLLKTGAIEEALSFLSDSVSEDEDNQELTNVIKDKMVAALIIGKKRRAKELNIDFNLLKGSALEKTNPYIPSLAMVTIIGNLIENSYEAINGKTKIREVCLYLNSSEKGLSIIVDDTGVGMTKETAETILEERFTTKGEGHGNGFSLIRGIVNEYGGTIAIESELGEGSSISVTFRKGDENN